MQSLYRHTCAALAFVCLLGVGSCTAAALPQQFSLNIGFDTPSPQEAPFQLTFHKAQQSSQPTLVTSSPVVSQPKPAPQQRKNFQNFQPQPAQQQQQQHLSFKQNSQKSQPSFNDQRTTSQSFKASANRRPQDNSRPQAQERESLAESHQDALKRNELHRKQLAEVIAQHNKQVESKIPGPPSPKDASKVVQLGPNRKITPKGQNSESQLEVNVKKNQKTGASEVRKFLFVSSKKSDDPKKKEIRQFTSVPDEYRKHLDSLAALNKRIDGLNNRVKAYLNRKKQPSKQKGERKQKQTKKKFQGEQESLIEDEDIKRVKGLLPLEKRNPRRN